MRGLKSEGHGHRHGLKRGGRRGGGRLLDHGALRWVLLDMISEKPAHGYELIKALEARLGGAYTPSPGVVYPTLTLLEEMGALVSQSEGGKKLYEITEAGRDLLAENAEAIGGAKAIMARFAARSMRPPAVEDAIGRLRGAIHERLAGDPPLSQDQIEAIAATLDRAAEEVRKA